MGYTHYFKNKRAFTDSEWGQFTSRVKEMLDNTRVPIANAYGEEGTSYDINDAFVSFNGVGDDSHEAAYMPKKAVNFEYCKTARKPYDELVVGMYKVAKEILGSGITLTSDGGSGVFDW